MTSTSPSSVSTLLGGAPHLLDGVIAKPRPMPPPVVADVPGGCAIAELRTPITSPRAFTSGPPELPGLIAASVWIALMNAASSSPPADTGRLSALTMPVVTVPASPSGAPTATTGSRRDDDRASESPSSSGVSPVTPTLRTARSYSDRPADDRRVLLAAVGERHGQRRRGRPPPRPRGCW